MNILNYFWIWFIIATNDLFWTRDNFNVEARPRPRRYGLLSARGGYYGGYGDAYGYGSGGYGGGVGYGNEGYGGGYNQYVNAAGPLWRHGQNKHSYSDKRTPQVCPNGAYAQNGQCYGSGARLG